MNNNKQFKKLSGSALLVSIVILASVFIISFGSAYMVFINMSKGVNLADKLKSEQTANAGIEKFKFELFSGNLDIHASCDNPIFTTSLNEDSYYIVYCDNSAGKNNFYSMGVYKNIKTIKKIKAKGLFEECGDYIFYEGDFYGTVTIGNQCWMDRNLNYDNNCSSNLWSNTMDTGWCGCYDASLENCGNYGLLYQWSAAMNGETLVGSQGICPVGWHMPSSLDWDTMINYIINNHFTADLTNVARWLKSCSQVSNGFCLECVSSETCPTISHPRWDYNASNYGINHYNFTALPGGYRYSSDGVYYNLGNHTSFWTSTPNRSNAYFYAMNFDSSNFGSRDTLKGNAFSVRCIKN